MLGLYLAQGLLPNVCSISGSCVLYIILVAQMVKRLPAKRDTRVQSLG